MNIESHLYPSPASDQLTVELNLVKPMDVTLEIVNAMGQVVLNKDLGTIARSTHHFDLEVLYN